MARSGRNGRVARVEGVDGLHKLLLCGRVAVECARLAGEEHHVFGPVMVGKLEDGAIGMLGESVEDGHEIAVGDDGSGGRRGHFFEDVHDAREYDDGEGGVDFQ